MAAKKGGRKKSGRKYGKAGEQTRRERDEAPQERHAEERTRRQGGKVKSRKQAIAIGLSEARKKGAKVPRKKSAKKRT